MTGKDGVLHGTERDINVAFNLIAPENFIEAGMHSSPDSSDFRSEK
ncbi:MAG TPA: hypothetical protein VGQ53_08375 [Chitinophagaceae bacterium]|jgi:hypothetical protein|nr:hypothetical protein [Chitinophagaceae bacterium]